MISTRIPLAAIVAMTICACSTTKLPDKPQTPGELAFQRTIKPLLEHRCVHCHNDKKPLAGLNFQDRSATLDPSKKFIIPGQPQNSRLYRAITLDSAHPRVMPGDGWGITSGQKAAFETWISEGAPWPQGRAGRLRKRTYQVETEDYL